MTEKPKIVFIGGSGRSGTNITKDIFSLHSKIVTLPFEYRFIIDPNGIIDFYNGFSSTWSPFIADSKIKSLENFLNEVSKKKLLDSILSKIIKIFNKDGKKFTIKSYCDWELEKWIPNFGFHKDELIRKLKDFEYNGAWPGAQSYSWHHKIYHSKPRGKKELAVILGEFIRNCIREILEKTGKDCFLEDNTWNILFAKELSEIIPDSKMMHVFRDPRDVIASFVKQRWCPSTVEQTTEWYLSIMTKWFDVKKNIPKDWLFEFKLEDLVDSPEDILIKTCNFINLPFEHRLLKLDLSRSNSGRWIKEFSKQEKLYINERLGPVLDKLNYE